VVSPDDLAGAVADIKAKHDGDIYVHGSPQLAQGLLDQGLVDQLNLMIFPVLLGSGKRLFSDADADLKSLTLTDAKTVGDGVSILVYEPA
jgi:dihydrofolate reductase